MGSDVASDAGADWGGLASRSFALDVAFDGRSSLPLSPSVVVVVAVEPQPSASDKAMAARQFKWRFALGALCRRMLITFPLSAPLLWRQAWGLRKEVI